MKSTLIKSKFEDGDWKFDRYFVECDCMTPNHLLVFDIDHDTKYISVSIMSDWRQVWYKRIWYALKYIFVNETFPYGNDVGVYIDNIDDFYEAITAIKNHFNYIKVNESKFSNERGVRDDSEDLHVYQDPVQR